VRECRAERDTWRACEIRCLGLRTLTVVHDRDEAFLARNLSTTFLPLNYSPDPSDVAGDGETDDSDVGA
jgi:hypothetical protein